MKKNIEIDENKNTVTVLVSVNKRNYVKEPIISFRTKDIALLLEKEGIKIETCLESDTIYNDGRNPKIDGKWVFKLKKQKKIPKKPAIKDAKNNLTKSKEDANIDSKRK